MGSRVRAASRYRESGPIFGEIAPEIMEETLIRLATENERSLRQLSGHAGCFKETQIVGETLSYSQLLTQLTADNQLQGAAVNDSGTFFAEFIFLLSEKWHLEQPARYQAVELLERFMIRQVGEMHKSSKEKVEEGPGSSWSSLKHQIYDTFVLRLVSCVQLASKLSLHYNIVNSDTALRFLQSLKYSYTKQDLLESELAVLKTLQFQINVSTPLAYVELLLEVLGHNGCLLPAQPLHQMCTQLLDFSYLTRDTIYDTLLKIAIENATPSKLQVAKFLTVKEDFMLLAVGIISTSVFVLNPEHWKEVVEHLNSITGITSQSILEFSYAVLKGIIGTSTPEQRPRNSGTNARGGRILPLP